MLQLLFTRAKYIEYFFHRYDTSLQFICLLPNDLSQYSLSSSFGMSFRLLPYSRDRTIFNITNYFMSYGCSVHPLHRTLPWVKGIIKDVRVRCNFGKKHHL